MSRGSNDALMPSNPGPPPRRRGAGLAAISGALVLGIILGFSGAGWFGGLGGMNMFGGGGLTMAGARAVLRLDDDLGVKREIPGVNAAERREAMQSWLAAIDRELILASQDPGFNPFPAPGTVSGRVSAIGRWWRFEGTLGVTDATFGKGAALVVGGRIVYAEAGSPPVTQHERARDEVKAIIERAIDSGGG